MDNTDKIKKWIEETAPVRVDNSDGMFVDVRNDINTWTLLEFLDTLPVESDETKELNPIIEQMIEYIDKSSVAGKIDDVWQPVLDDSAISGLIDLVESAISVKVLTQEDIAKWIANKIEMPYCWEDVNNRLNSGLPMPCALNKSELKGDGKVLMPVEPTDEITYSMCVSLNINPSNLFHRSMARHAYLQAIKSIKESKA